VASSRLFDVPGDEWGHLAALGAIGFYFQPTLRGSTGAGIADALGEPVDGSGDGAGGSVCRSSHSLERNLGVTGPAKGEILGAIGYY